MYRDSLTYIERVLIAEFGEKRSMFTWLLANKMAGRTQISKLCWTMLGYLLYTVIHMSTE